MLSHKELGYQEQRFTNMRKAISALKKTQPDFVVADFLYGYGNNYAGVNVSNLDVFLHSLQKYAPEAKVIVLVSKQDQQYIEKLANLFSLEAFFTYPVDQKAIGSVLS